MSTKTPLSSPDSSEVSLSSFDVSNPERLLSLAQQVVVVREYSGREWLHVMIEADCLVAFIERALDCGRPPRYEDILAVIARHQDSVLPCVALAAGILTSELDGLNPNDLELVLMTWWGANGAFFVNRASNRLLVKHKENMRVGNVMPGEFDLAVGGIAAEPLPRNKKTGPKRDRRAA